MVTLMPDFSFSLFSCTRSASRSVMSASSWYVTAGIITQLRARFCAEIFLMRDKGLVSIAPNLAKSTFGHGNKSSPVPDMPATGALAACAVVWVAPAITAWVKVWMSSCVMRPLGPEPLTALRGTPSSRANLRTLGLAWGRPNGAEVGL